MTVKKALLITAAILLLGGCTSTLHFPWVYRIDIPQGNFVTDKMVAQLKPGMTPKQVRYVMGPPTLIDPFTPGTWFYLMTFRPGEGEVQRQEIIVHFNNGLYDHYTGHVIADFRQKTKGQDDRQLKDKAERQSEEAVEAHPS